VIIILGALAAVIIGAIVRAAQRPRRVFQPYPVWTARPATLDWMVMVVEVAPRNYQVCVVVAGMHHYVNASWVLAEAIAQAQGRVS
jgi:hypothetical protein